MRRIPAYDAGLTNRSYDADGRLHIRRSRISKATVNPYYGREIPDADTLGLDPNRVYYLLRDPEELKKAAPSFARLPLMFKHVAVSADDPQQEQIAGTIGSDVEFEHPYLIADLSVWDAQAIAGVETDTVRELSCSYHYSADMTPGVFEGQPYDGVMRNISGNHVALVPSGRAGSDVLAADGKLEEKAMKETKFGKAIYAILCAISPKLAKDEKLKPLVIGVTRKDFDPKLLAPKLLAMDAEMSEPPTLAAMEAAKDAAELDDKQEDDEQKTAKDCSYCGAKDGQAHADGCTAKDGEKKEEGHENLSSEEREMAKDYAKAIDSAFSELEAKFKKEGKTDPGGLAYKIGVEKYGKKGMEEKAKAGKDAAMSKEAEDKRVKTAMDELKKDLREAEDARRAVRPVVGDVLAQDSAADIYGFALDQMKIDRKGVTGVAALRALFNVALSASKPAARPAFDAVPDMLEKFPNASREIRVL